MLNSNMNASMLRLPFLEIVPTLGTAKPIFESDLFLERPPLNETDVNIYFINIPNAENNKVQYTMHRSHLIFNLNSINHILVQCQIKTHKATAIKRYILFLFTKVTILKYSIT